MSPALLNKYLQAAREVADHMVLTPDGFDFAPHPMLVETDRDKYAIQRIVDFYERQPTDYADYFQAAWRFKYRVRPRQAGRHAGRHRGRGEGERQVSADGLAASSRNARSGEAGGRPHRQAAGDVARSARAAADQPTRRPLRAKCVEMRDFVVRIRNHTAMQFAAPVVRGLPAGSQPLLNWKLPAVRLAPPRFRPARLCATIPTRPRCCPKFRNIPGCTRKRRRAGPRSRRRPAPAIPIWWFRPPSAAAMKPRSRASLPFSRTHFTSSERGRYFPDDSEDKGRLLSAGYHNVMGYWRDDTPLMELILDDKGQKELNRLWDEFDFIADHTDAHLGSVLLQPERRGGRQGRRVRQRCARRIKEVSDRRRSFSDCATPISPRPQAEQQSRRHGGDPRSFPVGQRHTAAHGADARGGRAAATWTPCSSLPRAPTAGRCRRRNATTSWPITTRCARRTA